MGASVATGREMNRIIDPSTADFWSGVITRLVSTLENTESLTAKLEHFGHERHTVQTSALIEGGEDFLLAPDLN
jgi:hypothetical protein